MIHTARKSGATSTFAGSGGAIVGTYKDEAMFARLSGGMAEIGVAVIKPKIVA
jgi:glucuronokinase